MGAKRFAAVAVAGALLLAVGCASLTAPSFDGALSPQDTAQSRALALFAQGLVFEWDTTPDYEAALRAYRAAVALDPGNAELRHGAARMLIELGRHAEAQDSLAEAARALPNSATTHLALGRLAADRGDHTLAAHEFSLVAHLAATAPERLEALFLEAYAHFNRAADAEAIAALATAAAQADAATPPREHDVPRSSRIRALRFALELAELRLDATPTDSAERYAAWAADRTTNTAERADVWERYGVAALRKKRNSAAIGALRKTAEADPLRSPSLITAIALESDCDPRAVTSDVLGLRVAAEPNNVALRVALVRRLLDEHRYDEALPQVIAAAEKLRTRTAAGALPPEFWLLYGSAYERAGQPAKAEELFRQALVEHPRFAPILNYLAYMLAEQSRALEEAETLVRAALDAEPDNAAYLDTLGWVYHQVGRYADALVWLLRAAGAEPQDATVLDHIGDTLAKLDRTPESVAYWSMSYRLDSTNAAVAAKLTAQGVDLTRLLPPANTRNTPGR